MKRTEEELKKAKDQARRELDRRKNVSEEEDFLKRYRPKKIGIEIDYNKRLIEMRYEPVEEQHRFGLIVGNEPFESMYLPIEVGKRLDDTELQEELKKLRERKDDRYKIYKRISVNVASDYEMFKFLGLILEGFDALTADLWIKEEARNVKEYQEQKAKIEKVKRETPLFRITYQLDPLYELYDKKIARVSISGKGRRPEPETKQFIKELYEFLSPIFDEEMKSPEEKFEKKDITSVKIIGDVFEAFYGISKSEDAFRKALLKKITHPANLR